MVDVVSRPQLTEKSSSECFSLPGSGKTVWGGLVVVRQRGAGLNYAPKLYCSDLVKMEQPNAYMLKYRTFWVRSVVHALLKVNRIARGQKAQNFRLRRANM